MAGWMHPKLRAEWKVSQARNLTRASGTLRVIRRESPKTTDQIRSSPFSFRPSCLAGYRPPSRPPFALLSPLFRSSFALPLLLFLVFASSGSSFHFSTINFFTPLASSFPAPLLRPPLFTIRRTIFFPFLALLPLLAPISPFASSFNVFTAAVRSSCGKFPCSCVNSISTGPRPRLGG